MEKCMARDRSALIKSRLIKSNNCLLTCIHTMLFVSLYLPPVVIKWWRPWLTTFWQFNRILHCNNKNENLLTMETQSFWKLQPQFVTWTKKHVIFPVFLSDLHCASLFVRVTKPYFTHLESLLFLSFSAKFIINRLFFFLFVSVGLSHLLSLCLISLTLCIDVIIRYSNAF